MLHPTYKKFLTSVSRSSPTTARHWQYDLKRFQDFINHNFGCVMSPNEIITRSKLNELDPNYLDRYSMIDDFVAYLSLNGLSDPGTLENYTICIRSFFEYNDVEIMPKRFRRKVRLPKLLKKKQPALSAQLIRKILISCNQNKRLQTFLILLACTGARAGELSAARLSDFDMSCKPAVLHLRAENTKTKVSRDVFLTKEGVYSLRDWIGYKYRERVYYSNDQKFVKKYDVKPEDLVFSVTFSKEINASQIYVGLNRQFNELLESVSLGLGNTNGSRHRDYTFHSFRRHTFSTLETAITKDYADGYLGHEDSTYWSITEDERKRLFLDNAEKYLTFLDYSTLESTGKNIEAKLSEKEKEIQLLSQRDSVNTDAISTLSDQVMKLMVEVQELKKQQK
jgi:integrase